MIAPLSGALDGFYFHGVRGALLKQLRRSTEARDAFGRAIALAKTSRKRRTFGSISTGCEASKDGMQLSERPPAVRPEKEKQYSKGEP